MTQIAKVAVAAATYAIDKPYDYLVPSGMEHINNFEMSSPVVLSTESDAIIHPI